MSKIDHIEIPIDKIILLDKNPRTVSEEEFQKLCDDIKNDPAFLIQRPPLINKVSGKYYCYAGTQRIKACKSLNYKKIKCFVEENVSSKVQDERMLKDNLHRGAWNTDKLLDLDFEIAELESFGFEDFELGLDIENEPYKPEPNFDDEGIGYKSQYGVIVKCESEKDQESIFNKLREMGYECKIVVT